MDPKKRLILLWALLFPVFIQAQSITGVVFRDYNGNGTKDNTATYNEPGVGGITVTCTDGAGGTGTGTTSSATATLGQYALTGCAGAARVEFTGLEAVDYPSVHGGTSVQFVTVPATNVNFGINYPADYVGDTNPYLTTPIYVNGTYNNATSSSVPALQSFQYSNTGNSYGTQNPPNTKATIGQMGATWGVAYHKPSKTMFASAVLRRFAGLGPLGAGGIYKIDMTNPTAGSGATNYVNLNSIGIPVGNDSRTTTGCDAISTALGSPANDMWGADHVGRFGIGGIDIDELTNTMWLVNMTDSKLYGIKNIDPAATPTAADVVGGYTVVLPAPYTVNNGALRPWAVKAYRGKVYVGAVADGNQNAAAYPQSQADLKGYVLSFDPAQPASGFSVVTNFTFDYFHPSIGDTNGDFKWSNWQFVSVLPTWDDEYASQPIIMDMEFDTDGSIIVGVGDRGGLNTGEQNYGSIHCNTLLRNAGSSGDVLRLCKSGAGYVLSGNAGCTTTIPTNVLVDSDGDPAAPNSYVQEYYWGEAGPLTDNQGFNEAASGALASLRGTGQVMTTSMDPENWHSNGVITLNHTTGGWDQRYNVYFIGNQTWAQGKAVGIGDIELVTSPAPIEIGNRVWLDTDNDGIQDAGEAGISGVQVQLIKSGTTISTVTTDANGNYYFSSATGTDSASADYGITQLVPNMAYTVHFPTTATVSGTTYNLTTAAAGSNRLIDSNAPANGDVTILATDIPVAGANNHSFDVGYSAATCSINSFTVTPACNNNGTASDATDDYRTFSVTASGTGVATTYNASVNNSGTLTPTSGSYGSATNFRLQNGSAGNGTVYTLTLTDATTSSCTQTATISDPGSCAVASCSLSVTATPGACSSATNTYNVTGQFTFANAPTSGTLSATIGASSSTPITMTGTTTSPQSYTITGLTADGASHTVSASFSASPTCTGSINYNAPSSCTVTGQPDLQLIKTASTSTVSAGQTYAYTLALSNTGTATATGVQVRDLIPTGLTYVSSTASQGSYNQTTGIWTVGTVAVGASLTLTITVTVN